MSGAQGNRVNLPFWSRGTRLLLIPLGLGLAFTVSRLIFGLAAVTNLTDQYPWGIWVAIDIASGIALAAGGFTAAAFIEVFGRVRYRPLLRTALLTAWLGYLMESVILILDLGRYWNIWQVFLHWQGNSVLYEIALCVVSYILVLTVELSPAFAAGLQQGYDKKEKGYAWLQRFQKPLAAVPRIAAVVLPFFVLAGVVLSCMHQSSLGALLVIAPGKVHPLWYTPWLPVLFLLSAAMAGFPMVIIQYLAAHRSFRRRPDMEMMDRFAAKVPWLIGLYFTAKLADLIVRRRQIPWSESGMQVAVLTAELVIGLIIPFLLLIRRRVRRSPRRLFLSAVLVAAGVVFNRINVFLVGYRPPYADKPYFPSLGEMALTAATISAVIFFYRLLVIRFPILDLETARGEGLPEECEAPKKGRIGWVWRGLAALSLLGFTFFYASVHRRALAPTVPAPLPRPRISKARQPFSRNELYPLAYQDIYTMNNPGLNQASDRFGAVTFPHRIHDANVESYCAACHHRLSFSDDDRIGQRFTDMHQAIGMTIAGGSCQTCHPDLREKRFQKCSACHQSADEADDRSRPGLKGAYHLTCLQCHMRQPAAKAAPTGCTDCHQPRLPTGIDLLEKNK